MEPDEIIEKIADGSFYGISIDTSIAKGFVNRYEEVIAKPIGHSLVPIGRNEENGETECLKLRPVLVSDSILEATSATVFQKTPIMLQPRIKKKYELRCYLIGNDCISFKIPSNSLEYTKLDWRWGTTTLDFEPFTLAKDIVKKLRTYLSTVGLYYGVFDLIFTHDEDHVFLECNPDGNWHWLDEIVDGGLSTAYAKLLSRLHNALGDYTHEYQ